MNKLMYCLGCFGIATTLSCIQAAKSVQSSTNKVFRIERVVHEVSYLPALSKEEAIDRAKCSTLDWNHEDTTYTATEYTPKD